jgi:hypothetical protein
VYLTPDEVLYARDMDTSDALAEGALLARIARGILEGRSVPPVALYPEPLRRMRSVEVMVLLRSRGVASLWRSARGSSIARALGTACVVARERWHERAQALGGPLDAQLPNLDVEVALLSEDGTLSEADPAFIDRVFSPAHGVAYERTRAWRYFLPAATREKGGGSAMEAYRQLLLENSEEASLDEAQLRLYRLVVRNLGRSASPGLEATLPDPTRAVVQPAGLGAEEPDVDELLPADDWLPELDELDELDALEWPPADSAAEPEPSADTP